MIDFKTHDVYLVTIEEDDEILQDVMYVGRDTQGRFTYQLGKDHPKDSDLYYVHILSDEPIGHEDMFLSLYGDESYLSVGINPLEDFAEYADENFTKQCKKVIATTCEQFNDGEYRVNWLKLDADWVNHFIRNPTKTVELQYIDSALLAYYKVLKPQLPAPEKVQRTTWTAEDVVNFILSDDYEGLYPSPLMYEEESIVRENLLKALNNQTI